jgi:ferredoxin-NADP reductase
MAMIRHRAAAGSDADVRLLLSVKTRADIIYRAELEASGVALHVTLTREAADGWTTGRIDLDLVRAVGPDPAESPHIYVCGPTPFVEAAAQLLVAAGHAPARVRTERFGNTGG